MDTNDLLLNYMNKTSTWIQIDTLNNIDNYKFIFLLAILRLVYYLHLTYLEYME